MDDGDERIPLEIQLIINPGNQEPFIVAMYRETGHVYRD